MKKISKNDLKLLLSDTKITSIDNSRMFKNLPSGYWVYDKLLNILKQNGWHRFAPGFKSGVYGKEKSDYCIKILGMGVGENPLYFCEKGEYLQHERCMIEDFRKNKFIFLPNVLSVSDSIEFLKRECGVDEEQAFLRCTNNDLLIIEYIRGIPFATQTGYNLDYKLNIDIFNGFLMKEMEIALYELKKSLDNANRLGLVHNDPMPPNIIFTLDGNSIIAKLVDFELAQNLNKISPTFVNNSVKELYNERDVPFNERTQKFKKNLDQHLLSESILVFNKISSVLDVIEKNDTIWDGVSISIPFINGISINLGSLVNLFKK